MDRISPNFIYAFILTRSRLGLLLIIFRTFVPELWPLIYAKMFVSAQYLENIWIDFDQTILTRSTLGLLAVIFRKFVRELWPLIDVRIMLPLNILRNSGLLLHAKHCSGTIVRFSDNSSFHRCILYWKLFLNILKYIWPKILPVLLKMNR